MTVQGVSYLVNLMSRQKMCNRKRAPSRSYPPSIVAEEEEGYPPPPDPYRTPSSTELSDDGFFHRDEDSPTSSVKTQTSSARQQAGGGWERVSGEGEDIPDVGMSRIQRRTLDKAFDNSDRRQYGMGIVGRMLRRSFRKSVKSERRIQEQMEDMEDHRPFFTWWVTTVQVLICIISIICYGYGPVGVELHQRSGLVLVTSLSLQQVDYFEPASFWLGPRAADLIHLGAKFAPCMRNDERIFQEIALARKREKETACCIRNDNSGCVQTSQAECSETLSTWKKWTFWETGPGQRTSGSVCGQDPSYCREPASVAPFEWPDDITKWPVCKKRVGMLKDGLQGGPPGIPLAADHMVCEVIGHPCCIGVHGECRITTKEHCDFVRGFFHEEAALCSQVSCLTDVCGMIPFYNPEVPDQFYRLFTSLFLHAGKLHLLITILIQMTLMRDLEKLAGPLRIGIIYIISGIAGNLASAIFVPYRAEVGPAGSQFGLLACLFVEVINVWPLLSRPLLALAKLCLITLFLFTLGLLPWVDNYAHVFGFIFGFLLSYALLPFLSFGPYDRRRKILLICVCMIAVIVLFALLNILFYVTPIYECEVCQYLNCIPLTRDFCAEQNINYDRKTDPV